MKIQNPLREAADIDRDEAMRFRIPLRVSEILVLPNGNAYPVCPHCNVTLEREYQSYCDRCGQCLDWKYYGSARIKHYGEGSD